MRTFYNDNDKFAAAWTRELIARGHISEGVVDGRSITEIHGRDVAGFLRCNWFAGIGGWDVAFRLAGWPDDRPVWSASCPCPPFSAAGKKKRCPECAGKPIPHPLKTGVFACVPCGHQWHADGRHLWPEMLRIIRECHPPTIFGEQVAGEDGLQWLDGVSATLEAEGYAVGSADLPAASVGAPHIRQRLYWVATLPGASTDRRMGHPVGDGLQGIVGDRAASGATDRTRTVGGMAHPETPVGRGQGGSGYGGRRDAETGGSGTVGGMADCNEQRLQECSLSDIRGQEISDSAGRGADGGMADDTQGRRRRRDEDAGRSGEGIRTEGTGGGPADDSPSGGFWSDYVAIACRDGKHRRAEPRIQPLVAGLPKGVVRSRDPGAPLDADKTSEARSMRLRGYGNAICVQVAAKFIKAFLEAEKEMTR